MIDPQAKMARVRAEAAAKANKPKRKRLTRAALHAMKTAIATDSEPKLMQALADKSLATLADTSAAAVRQARKTLQNLAPEYVRLHLAACKLALVQRDPDVTRKGAEAMMDRITATSADGTVERIVDRPAATAETPRIQIGIALGGLPRVSSAGPIIDA